MNIDILILSNGPGELATWVRPVVKAIRQKWGEKFAEIRISLILSPCPHSTGKEAIIARSYPEIHRVQEPEHFLSFLLTGKTAENWDWYNQGIVVFLGGDQLFPIWIGKRLNYQTLIYSEWEARWQKWADHFAIMNPHILKKINPKYTHKFTIVGDLMADIVEESHQEYSPIKSQDNALLIGILPGSKPAKLGQGVPLTLGIAHYLHQRFPETEFMIPVAPTLNVETLAKFAHPQSNSLVNKMGGISAQLLFQKDAKGDPYLETNTGLKIKLFTENPAYHVLSQCTFCLTTVGANTAELGALGVPMFVLLPTQQLDAMRAWDGLPGILANLPLLGSLFARIINGLVLKQGKLFAWPNIWAKREIVPELVGDLDPEKVANFIGDHYLQNPEQLQQIRENLKEVRGNPGASQKIAEIIYNKFSATMLKP